MKKNIVHDEVDLIDFILIILQNKWKIILITIFAIIGTYLYQVFQTPFENKFKASTEIRPISTFEESEYSIFNFYVKKITRNDVFNLEKNSIIDNETFEDKNKKDINQNLRDINKIYLNELFIEKLQDREFLKKSIKKFNLIKKEDYKDTEAYEEATTKLANLIKLSSTISKNKITSWKINFQTVDKKNWENFLRFLEKSANYEVQKYLQETFEKLFLNQHQLKKYELEDIDSEISSARESYDIRMSNRVAFLMEQAAIARKLNIARTTDMVINSQTLSTSSEAGIITNLITEIPYYMKGYEMIEKEIELIQNRVNKSAFMKDLFELEKKKNKLITDKNIERIEEIFQTTPIVQSSNFYASKIIVEGTKYITKKNGESSLKLKLIIAAILGTVFSIFYVYISSALKRRI